MEGLKIENMTLRPDQVSRLSEFGFKFRELKNPMQWIYNTMSTYDVLMPKTAEILQMPDPNRGGCSGIARIQPRDSEGYVWKFQWRPAIDDVPARMTGLFRLNECVHKPGKKKGEREDEDDTGSDALHA